MATNLRMLAIRSSTRCRLGQVEGQERSVAVLTRQDDHPVEEDVEPGLLRLMSDDEDVDVQHLRQGVELFSALAATPDELEDGAVRGQVLRTQGAVENRRVKVIHVVATG